MKRVMAFILVFSLLLIFSPKPAEAGISVGTSGITLSAGESMEVCDIWVYATQEGGTYHVSTTSDLQPLTVSITPNEFALDPVDCPHEEESARRACIAEACTSGDGSLCKVVCVKFTAPMLIEWNPEKVVYDGSVLNSIKVGVATINEPFVFSVHVNPMDMKPIVTGIVVVIIVIAILVILFVFKRKR